MTCYNPIIAYVYSIENGTKKLRFVSHKEDIENGEVYKDDFGNKHPDMERLLLPCGRCIGCLIKRSRDWAIRMMCELTYHEKACFITLTFNDESIYNPELDMVRHYVDSNGELSESFTLQKRPFQLFMKRLRKYFSPEEIRYFACGEYGERTKRPHYHAILFGIDFSEDRYVYQIDSENHPQYRSPTLEKIWPFGFSLIAEVNFQTCAYVSRYCTKKKYGSQNMYYQIFNVEPEFNLMSRRPGIGKKWFEEHYEEVYINQEIFFSTLKGGMKVRPPKYYDKLYDVECPEEMESIREARKKIAMESNRLKVEQSGMNLFELLAAEEENFKKRIKSLRRDKV